MKAKDFMQELDEAEQAELIWDSVLLGDRMEGDYKILLYQVQSFYVEVFYDSGLNVIRKFSAFENTDL